MEIGGQPASSFRLRRSCNPAFGVVAVLTVIARILAPVISPYAGAIG